MANGDQGKIMKAIDDYRHTPRGIAETKEHNPGFAEQLAVERQQMLARRGLSEANVEYSDTHMVPDEQERSVAGRDYDPKTQMSPEKIAQQYDKLCTMMDFDPSDPDQIEELGSRADEVDYLRESTHFKSDAIGVDPANCGCTDCLTGHSIPDNDSRMYGLLYAAHFKGRAVLMRNGS